MDGQGDFLYGWYPSTDDRFPSSYRAELSGVLGVLERAALPITIVLDNAAVVEDFARGRDFCRDAKRKGADPWRKVWRQIGELGDPVLVELHWTKGHATDAEVARGRTTELRRMGNVKADELAGEGSVFAKEVTPNGTMLEANKKVVPLTKCIAPIAKNW